MNVLKKLYDKSKIWFAIAWIIAYCVLMSVGDALSASIGIDKSVTLVVGFLLSAILLLFLKKTDFLRSMVFARQRLLLSLCCTTYQLL